MLMRSCNRLIDCVTLLHISCSVRLLHAFAPFWVTETTTIYSFKHHAALRCTGAGIKSLKLNSSSLTTDQYDSELAFSFTLGGLLFPFQLGVCDVLLNKNFLTNRTPIAGSSAGALTAAVVGSGLNLQEVMAETESLCENCRIQGTRGRLKDVLVDSLERMLPEDVHERIANRHASVGISYTVFNPLPLSVVASEFDSKEDLIQCLLASCHVPFWFNGKPVTQVRGRMAVDGFFGTPTRYFGAPAIPKARFTVRVSVFPSNIAPIDSDIEGGVISPDLIGSFLPPDLLQLALNPGSPKQLLQLFEMGQVAADCWVEKYGDFYRADVSNTPPKVVNRTIS